MMNKLKRVVKSCVKQLDDAYYHSVIKRAEYVKIEERKASWEQVSLTKEQIEEINAVYGFKVDTRWHRYFQYYTGKFDAQYLPDNIFALSMEGKMNPRKIASELEDKIRLPILYSTVPGLVLPKTVVSNASGIYYDGNYNVISKAEADAIVKQFLEENFEAIKKPTRDSGGGEGIQMLCRDTFEALSFDENFIVQERIVNQEDIRTLNPSSLNTMRVITYICDNQYFCAPLAMRMGCGTSRLDNITSGGICIGVMENGELCDHAYTEFRVDKYAEHPSTGVKFEGYRIRNVDKVINAAIECHKRTPHMIMASWDFTLNENGQPVLIEVNLTRQSESFPQYTHGRSLFGENTAKMLEIRNKKGYL